jgi:hypothetical protein
LFKKALLFLAAAPVIWLAFAISDARSFETTVLGRNDAEKKIVCDGIERTNSNCILVVLSKSKVSPFTYLLINESVGRLWGWFYAVLGLAGGLAYYYYLIWQGKSGKEFDWDRIVSRLLLVAAFGAIFHLILDLPAPILAEVFGDKFKDLGGSSLNGQESVNALRSTLVVVPAMAGFFPSEFLEWVKKVFLKVLRHRQDDGAGTAKAANI